MKPTALPRRLIGFALPELLSGMALTLRYFFSPKVTLSYPQGKRPTFATLPWRTRLTQLSQRRRTMHRL